MERIDDNQPSGSQNQQRRGRPATGQSGQKPRRPRDVERMNAYAQKRHEQAFGEGNWANLARIDADFEEASDRLRPVRRGVKPKPSIG